MFGNKEAKIEKAIAKKNASALLSLINDKDESIRIAAIAGLGKTGGDDSFNALITSLRDDNAKIRIAAANALGDMHETKARAHIDHLIKNEKNADVLTAMHAAQTKIHDKE